MTEESIFVEALDRPDPAARAAFLDEACGTDAALRRQVEALLDAHFKSGEFLDVPAAQQGRAASPTDVTVTVQEQAATIGPDGADGSDDLHFLTPSRRPDSLGRIGHFEVLQVLGKGGFGIVFRAFDEVMQRVVAVKVMAPQLAATSPARKRFLREAQSSAQVRHENVVQVHQVVEHPLPYLVMEFIPGETLQQRLDRTGPLDVPEILRIGREIAEGLAAAHATDLIHRDIKPSNILIEAGAQHRAKITDFGLARAADDASISQSGIIAGTPMYMAPEQALGQKLDQRADLFSLGSVLYQMASGRPPFRATGTVAVLKRVAEDTPRPIREIIPEVPEWFCRIVGKLHAKKPEDRYQSAREVADVLADCERQLATPQGFRDFSKIPGGAPRPARSRLKQAVVTAGLLAAAVLVSGFLLFGTSLYRYAANRGEIEFAAAGDPDVEKLLVWRDGALVAVLDRTNTRAAVEPGDYELEAVCANSYDATKFFLETTRFLTAAGSFERTEDWPAIRFTVRRGESAAVTVTAGRRPGRASTVGGDWVQLFNGKDLTGWKMHPDAPGNWAVADGILKGSQKKGFLFTDRGDYGNFHLRAEVRVNAAGDCNICFRAPYSMLRVGPNWEYFGVPDCYLVYLRRAGGPLGSRSTISVARADRPSGPPAPPVDLTVAPEDLVRPDEWFTLELIADGNRFVTRINGADVAACSDPLRAYSKGHLALNTFTDATVVEYRKIEVRDLPASQPAADRWVSLFNGKDLTGWKKHPRLGGFWHVDETGVLIATGPVEQSYLATQRGDFEHFHLRMEIQVDGPSSDSGVFLRVPFPEFQDFAEVNISFDSNRPLEQTGTVLIHHAGATQLRSAAKGLAEAGRWFTLEIIAQGDVVRTLVDGKPGVTTRLPGGSRRGHILLQQAGDKATVRFRKIAVKELPASPSADHWASLFNGKDLTGWKTHADAPGLWAVEGGVLKGGGKNGTLFTDRGDYENFRFRAEVRVNAAADGSIRFRAPYALMRVLPEEELFAVPECYLMYVHRAGPFPLRPTITLARAGKPGGDRPVDLCVAPEGLVGPDEWFVLELTAEGNRFVTKINGREVANCSDPLKAYTKGHIALTAFTPATVVEFRKIEIQELSTDTDPSTPAAIRHLRDAVAAKAGVVETEKRRHEAGASSPVDVILAEAELAEARIQLAEAEQKPAVVRAALGTLIKHREAERGYVAERVAAGLDRPDALSRADARLAEARARLAKAGPNLEGPPPAVVQTKPAPGGKVPTIPFDPKEAADLQAEWAGKIGEKVEFKDKKLDMEFRVIPPGDFEMGAKDEEIKPDIDQAKKNMGPGWRLLVRTLQAETPRHPVRITRPFAIGKYEVTVGEFRKFVDATKYKTTVEQAGGHGVVAGVLVQKKEYSWKNVGYEQADRAPVWNVSRDDAVEFCKWLSKETGRTFRLPTEAEWEWACRAGTDTRTFWAGERAADAHVFAWGSAKTGRKPRPVGGLNPNAFGLNDTCGNVWEWCNEWFGETYYKGSPVADPPGPTDPQGGRGTRHRAQRGGGVDGTHQVLSSTARGLSERSVVGFRVVCEFAGDVRLPDPETKNPLAATIGPLREVVAATARTRETAAARVAAGIGENRELFAAEVAVTEARIKLAEAERNQTAVAELLEELVTHLQAERDLIALLRDSGRVASSDLDQAEARLAMAKARRASGPKP